MNCAYRMRHIFANFSITARCRTTDKLALFRNEARMQSRLSLIHIVARYRFFGNVFFSRRASHPFIECANSSSLNTSFSDHCGTACRTFLNSGNTPPAIGLRRRVGVRNPGYCSSSCVSSCFKESSASGEIGDSSFSCSSIAIFVI